MKEENEASKASTLKFIEAEKAPLNPKTTAKSAYELQDQLWQAVKAGNLAKAAAAIKSGADVDKEIHGYTPLSLACIESSEDMANYLINERKKAQNKEGALYNLVQSKTFNEEQINEIRGESTLLADVCALNNLELAELLIAKGAKPDIGKSLPIFGAAYWGNVSLLKLLVENGVELDAEDGSTFFTALSIAAKRSKFDAVKFLVDSGAKVDAGIFQPLYCAAAAGDVKISEYLLEAGADVNRDTRGYTPLHIAALRGNLEMIKVLIKAGADINALSCREEDAMPHYTALDLLIMKDNLSLEYAAIIKELVNAGATIDQAFKDSFNSKGAQLAKNLSNKTKEVYDLVMENHGSKIRGALKDAEYWIDKFHGNYTALQVAAANGKDISLRALVEVGANINLKSRNGETVLELANKYKKFNLGSQVSPEHKPPLEFIKKFLNTVSRVDEALKNNNSEEIKEILINFTKSEDNKKVYGVGHYLTAIVNRIDNIKKYMKVGLDVDSKRFKVTLSKEWDESLEIDGEAIEVLEMDNRPQWLKDIREVKGVGGFLCMPISSKSPEEETIDVLMGATDDAEDSSEC